MTTKQKEMELAYVLGKTMGDKTGDHKSIELGCICDEWKDYRICGFASSERNGNWFLYFDGPFGASMGCSKIMTVDEGLSIMHTVHIFMQGILCHKAELK